MSRRGRFYISASGALAASAFLVVATAQAAEHGASGALAQEALWQRVLSNPSDLFNGVIAICTVILAFIGLWQASIARGAARRQLRAYVSINPNTLYRFVVGLHPQIECVVRNHGLTPAFNIRYKFKIAILPMNSALPLEFPSPDQALVLDNTLFPGELKSWFNHDEALTAAQVASIKAGQDTLYIWGIVRYRDAFGRTRSTEFNAALDGPSYAAHLDAIARKVKTPPAFFWSYGQRHNHAT